MSGFHYNGQELNHELVAAVAQLLDKASIFNLLWGDYALRFLGVPAVPNVSFKKALIQFHWGRADYRPSRVSHLLFLMNKYQQLTPRFSMLVFAHAQMGQVAQ